MVSLHSSRSPETISLLTVTSRVETRLSFFKNSEWLKMQTDQLSAFPVYCLSSLNQERRVPSEVKGMDM